VLRVVLEVIRPHRAVPLVRDLALTLSRRRPHLVDRARRRDIEHLPAAQLQPVAEVQVLAEHEVARVEESDPVERRPPQHQAGRGAGVHLVDVRLRQVPHVVAAEARAPGKEPAQADRLIEERAGDGERTPRVGIPPAVGQEQTRPGRAGVGTGEQEVREPRDTLRVEPDVGAQEQDETALAALETDVRGLGFAPQGGRYNRREVQAGARLGIGQRLAALQRNRLVRQNLVLFSGGLIAGVGGFVYHAIAGRVLGPATYGQVAFLIAVYAVG